MSSFRPRTITGTNAGSADTIQLVRYDMIRLIRYAKADAFKLLLGRRYNRVKKAEHDGGKGKERISGAQVDPHLKTADRLAAQHGVSPATVKRAHSPVSSPKPTLSAARRLRRDRERRTGHWRLMSNQYLYNLYKNRLNPLPPERRWHHGREAGKGTTCPTTGQGPR